MRPLRGRATWNSAMNVAQSKKCIISNTFYYLSPDHVWLVKNIAMYIVEEILFYTAPFITESKIQRIKKAYSYLTLTHV